MPKLLAFLLLLFTFLACSEADTPTPTHPPIPTLPAYNPAPKLQVAAPPETPVASPTPKLHPCDRYTPEGVSCQPTPAPPRPEFFHDETTRPTATPVPTLPAPRGLHVSPLPDTDLSLTWESVPGASGYKVEKGRYTESEGWIWQAIAHTAEPRLVTRFGYDIERKYRVLAYAGRAASTPSDAVRWPPFDPPDPPRNLTLTKQEGLYWLLEWEAPEGAHTYTIEQRVGDEGAEWVEIVAPRGLFDKPLTDTRYSFALDAECCYWWRVIAWGSSGGSAPSEARGIDKPTPSR